MKAVAIGLAVVFFVLAALYGAGVLQFGAHEPGPHIKHAVLFGILGILSLVWLRFAGGNTTDASVR